MSWKNLIPWDWFKHEENQGMDQNSIPIEKRDKHQQSAMTHPIMQLHNEIDKLFNDAFHRFDFPLLRSRFKDSDTFWNETNFSPNLNVSSSDENYIISVEAPGMSEEDLSIELKENVLVIKGNKQQKKEEKEDHYYRSERIYGSFQRVLSLPEDANAEDIEAKMKDGVLTLNIPRQEVDESQVKKIAIN